ncbi:MAG TPA: hypothetical protein VFZ78_06055, partial [Flavisolibacter sp.]
RIRRLLPAILQAAFINFVSLVACFLTLYLSEQEQWGDYTSQDLEASNELAWVALYLISVLLETALLKVLNRARSWKRLLLASLVMNVITFLVLYVYVYYNQ